MKYESDFRALREEYESLQGQLAALEKEKDDMSITFNQNVAEKEIIIQSLNSQLIEAQKLAELQRKELNFSSLWVKTLITRVPTMKCAFLLFS